MMNAARPDLKYLNISFLNIKSKPTKYDKV